MTVHQVSPSQVSTSVVRPIQSVAPAKILGTLGMIGAPFLLLESLFYGLQPHADTRLTGALQLVYIGGWMCSMVGLWLLNATGKRLAGKIVLTLQLFGLTLAAGLCLLNIAGASAEALPLAFQITDTAWPLSHLFMLVVGIATLVAKPWTGWRRFAPLLCGLAIPVLVVGGMVAGEAVMAIFPAFTGLAFLTLGYVVRTAQPDRA